MKISIENYFYSEFTESHSDPETNGSENCYENKNKKVFGKRRRSRSLKSRLSTQNNNPGSKESKQQTVSTQLKPIDPVDCPKCFSTVKVVSLVRHIWDHIWDHLSCPFKEDSSFNLCHHCCRNFKSKQALQAHFLGINWFCDNFCMICMIQFPTEQLIFDHMKTHHTRQSVPLVCKLCPYKSSTLFHFWHHYAENHILPICLFCLEVFYSGEALIITSNNSFKKRQADAFSLYNEIAHHLYLHGSSIGMYDCDKCTLTFTCSSDLIVHQKFSHTNIKTRTSKQLVDKASNFKYINFQVPQQAFEIKYFDEEFFMEMLGTSPRKVTLSSIIKHVTSKKAYLNLTKQVGHQENYNSQLENYICQECMSPVQQPMNLLTGLKTHYFDSFLRCRKTFGAEKVRCKFSTRCIEMFIMHEHFHKVRMNADDRLQLSDWSQNWPKDPEECLFVCYNCYSYFETYDQLIFHINISKHISLAHSFEEEIRSYNQVLQNQSASSNSEN